MKGSAKNPRKGLDSSERRIGKAIITEWISAITEGGREMNPHALAQAIRNELKLDGPGQNDKLEVGIITDPVHREQDDQGRPVKFIWVCVPAPELMTEDWLTTSGYARRQGGALVPDDTKSDELGEAVLFGCGR